MNIDPTITEIQRLGVQEKDVIIFKISNIKKFSPEKMHQTSKLLKHYDYNNLILFVSEEDDVTKFDERKMNQLGWYRKDSVDE